MLNHIYIKDLVTIETLDLNLPGSSIMITGETGAGKSIFIEAIELALGERASPNMIRVGKEKADISLCFDITHFPKVFSYLKTHDLEQAGNECMIRRVIMQDGRSRIYVNGAPTTLQHVKALGELLFHVHGQYEQQVLLKSDYQREVLDRFADTLSLADEVKKTAEEGKLLAAHIQTLKEQTTTRAERANFLRFQLDEFHQLKLEPNEWETLEAEHHRLTHAEELLRNIEQTIHLLSEDESKNAHSLIHQARKTLESIQSIETKSNEWMNTLNAAAITLKDLSEELTHYLENASLDAHKLQQVEERVSNIFALARKHKVKPEELCLLQQKLTDEFEALNTSDETLEALAKKLYDIEKQYEEKANQLSSARLKASKKLEKEITETIRSLSLPHGEFHIVLEKEEQPLSLHGHEKIIFQIKTNPDQRIQPLAKVISGGELSRLSLAVHLALAKKTTVPTLIFDEIDTGLSGKTAEKIGKLLRQLGETYQVFCITHQPQVAALGKHQLLVEKYFKDNTTYTGLKLLDHDARKLEIARMLGGETITDAVLAHASMLVNAT